MCSSGGLFCWLDRNQLPDTKEIGPGQSILDFKKFKFHSNDVRGMFNVHRMTYGYPLDEVSCSNSSQRVDSRVELN